MHYKKLNQKAIHPKLERIGILAFCNKDTKGVENSDKSICSKTIGKRIGANTAKVF